MTPREELAARLDSARRRKNLSIRAVARLVDVPAATVQGWLSGKHAPTPALRPQFERLVRALGLEGEVQPEWLDVDRALGTLRSGDTPYVGLRPYATTEERLFFGRDVEAARIATAVRHHAPTHGLVALVGPSGSGKSSLLAAGLVGRHCAPGGLLEHRRGRVLPVRDLTTHPDTGDADLIVLDQFEELLDLGADRDATLAAVVDLAARVTVVLGIRSDAYGRLAELGDLRDALERPILVQPMAPEEIRQAITGPAALRDVEVDPGLVELVLADTGAAEDPQATLTLLPLVSHALLMTWGAGSGQRMTVDDYRRAGGLSSAVENLADGIVASLSTEQRRTARALFMRMVGLLDDRAVRRPVALASLSAATLAVARPFVDARVLSTTETQLHISHDSVLRHWPRLADWIEDGREQLRVREHLSRATRLWVDSGRSPDGLIPVDRLPMFAGLGLDDSTDLLSPLEDEFLTESRAHFTSQLAQERRTSARLRRGRALAFGLTALTLVLALLATGAFLQTRQVQLDAQSRQVANQASTLRDRDPNLYAQLALVSAALAPTREARSSLLVATSLDVPTRWTAPGSSFATTGPGGSVVQVDGAGGVALWRADTIHGPPDVRFTADPAGGQLFAVALTRAEDRLLLLTGGAGGYRALWDVTDEPTTLADLGGAGTLFGAAFDPTGPRFALAHSDGTTSTVELWHLDRPAGPQRLGAQTFDGQVSALAFTPDGGRVLTAGTRDHIGVWTVTASGLEPADPIPLGADPGIRALSLAISPDGSSLAAGLTSGQVATWPLDGAGTTPPRLTSVSSFWINGVAFSGDGSQLLTGDSEQRLHVWASDTMEHLRGIRAPAIVQSVAWAGPEPMATLVDGTLLHWGGAQQRPAQRGWPHLLPGRGRRGRGLAGRHRPGRRGRGAVGPPRQRPAVAPALPRGAGALGGDGHDPGRRPRGGGHHRRSGGGLGRGGSGPRDPPHLAHRRGREPGRARRESRRHPARSRPLQRARHGARADRRRPLRDPARDPAQRGAPVGDLLPQRAVPAGRHRGGGRRPLGRLRPRAPHRHGVPADPLEPRGVRLLIDGAPSGCRHRRRRRPAVGLDRPGPAAGTPPPARPARRHQHDRLLPRRVPARRGRRRRLPVGVGPHRGQHDSGAVGAGRDGVGARRAVPRRRGPHRRHRRHR